PVDFSGVAAAFRSRSSDWRKAANEPLWRDRRCVDRASSGAYHVVRNQSDRRGGEYAEHLLLRAISEGCQQAESSVGRQPCVAGNRGAEWGSGSELEQRCVGSSTAILIGRQRVGRAFFR